MSKDNNNIGMICEQGDLGLFFDPLSDKDKKILKEQEEYNEKKKSSHK